MTGDWDRALSGLGPVGPIARDRVRPEPEPAVVVEAELAPWWRCALAVESGRSR